MDAMVESAQPSPLEEDFSIVIGGPLFQALRRAHLTGDALEMVRRRIVVFALIAWLPLFALAVLDGKAWGGAVAVPFLYDVDAHARFLIALPLLIVAELLVYRRMRAVVAQFVTLGLVRGAVRERFDRAIASAMRPTLSEGTGSPVASRVQVVPESTLRQIPHSGPYARR